MTDRLYYSDATCLAFDAVVRHLDPSRLQVVLDRSAFYPTSGGQPHDIGVLAGIPVVDVTESDEHVVHHLSAPLAASVGDRVDGVVDAARRFDHMQQHSGQHLLSAVLEDRYGWPTVSVHFGSDSCSLDLRTDAVAAHDLIEAERLVNGHVFENRAIRVGFEDADTATGLRKPSERGGLLRIVTIDGLDRNACGGTHVSRTGEIGPVLLRRTERTRGTTRVEFRCGHRAIMRARHDMERLLDVAGMLSAGADDVPALVRTLSEERRTLDRELARATEQLLSHEARALHTETPLDAAGRRLIVSTRDDIPVKTLQPLAQQVVAFGNAVYLAVSISPPAVLLAASSDTGLACGTMLREALQAVGGRGGGTAQLAQGSAPTPEMALACRTRLLATLSGVPADA
jgi:alanyl-tRNA synthetase